MSSFNLSSIEPRKYIKRDQLKNVFSTSPTCDKNKNKNSLYEIKTDECVNKKNRIDESEEKNENIEEWAEIKLTSPDVNDYKKSFHSDDDDNDSIPYKPLPSETSSDAIHGVSENGACTVTCKKFVNNPLFLMNKKTGIGNYFDKFESTKNSSTKSRRKIDSNLTNWITGSSAGESSSSKN